MPSFKKTKNLQAANRGPSRPLARSSISTDVRDSSYATIETCSPKTSSGSRVKSSSPVSEPANLSSDSRVTSSNRVPEPANLSSDNLVRSSSRVPEPANLSSDSWVKSSSRVPEPANLSSYSLVRSSSRVPEPANLSPDSRVKSSNPVSEPIIRQRVGTPDIPTQRSWKNLETTSVKKLFSIVEDSVMTLGEEGFPGRNKVISRVCSVLKKHGIEFEKEFRGKINNIISSFRNLSHDLRLDFISRIQLLEVVELRAAGWVHKTSYYKDKLSKLEIPDMDIEMTSMDTTPESLSNVEIIKPSRCRLTDEYFDVVVVNRREIGAVMGVAGEVINSIRSKTDTIIEVTKDKCSPEREIRIAGPTAASVQEVKSAVEMCISRNLNSPGISRDEKTDTDGNKSNQSKMKVGHWFDQSKQENVHSWLQEVETELSTEKHKFVAKNESKSTNAESATSHNFTLDVNETDFIKRHIRKGEEVIQDTVSISTKQAKSVFGLTGEYVKDIMESSGAFVRFLPSDGGLMQSIEVKGNRAAVNKAKVLLIQEAKKSKLTKEPHSSMTQVSLPFQLPEKSLDVKSRTTGCVTTLVVPTYMVERIFDENTNVPSDLEKDYKVKIDRAPSSDSPGHYEVRIFGHCISQVNGAKKIIQMKILAAEKILETSFTVPIPPDRMQDFEALALSLPTKYKVCIKKHFKDNVAMVTVSNPQNYKKISEEVKSALYILKTAPQITNDAHIGNDFLLEVPYFVLKYLTSEERYEIVRHIGRISGTDIHWLNLDSEDGAFIAVLTDDSEKFHNARAYLSQAFYLVSNPNDDMPPTFGSSINLKSGQRIENIEHDSNIGSPHTERWSSSGQLTGSTCSSSSVSSPTSTSDTIPEPEDWSDEMDDFAAPRVWKAQSSLLSSNPLMDEEKIVIPKKNKKKKPKKTVSGSKILNTINEEWTVETGIATDHDKNIPNITKKKHRTPVEMVGASDSLAIETRNIDSAANKTKQRNLSNTIIEKTICDMQKHDPQVTDVSTVHTGEEVWVEGNVTINTECDMDISVENNIEGNVTVFTEYPMDIVEEDDCTGNENKEHSVDFVEQSLWKAEPCQSKIRLENNHFQNSAEANTIHMRGAGDCLDVKPTISPMDSLALQTQNININPPITSVNSCIDESETGDRIPTDALDSFGAEIFTKSDELELEEYLRKYASMPLDDNDDDDYFSQQDALLLNSNDSICHQDNVVQQNFSDLTNNQDIQDNLSTGDNKAVCDQKTIMQENDMDVVQLDGGVRGRRCLKKKIAEKQVVQGKAIAVIREPYGPTTCPYVHKVTLSADKYAATRRQLFAITNASTSDELQRQLVQSSISSKMAAASEHTCPDDKSLLNVKDIPDYSERRITYSRDRLLELAQTPCISELPEVFKDQKEDWLHIIVPQGWFNPKDYVAFGKRFHNRVSDKYNHDNQHK